MQAHQAVVHTLETRPRKPHHIEFDAVAREIVEERTKEVSGVATFEEHPVNQVYPQQSDRLLLPEIVRFKQPGMQQDLGRLCPGLVLETDADPAPSIHARLGAAGRHRVRQGEECRRGAALLG